MRSVLLGGLALAATVVACGGVNPPATVPVSGIRMVVDTTYYPVAGRTPREWLASSPAAAAKAGIPNRYQALTVSAPRWTYNLRPTNYGCEPREVVVLLGVSFIMPQLESESGVSEDNMLEWRRRMHSLWVHEEGHATRAMRSAVEIRDSLRVLHEFECGALRSRVAAATRGVTEKYHVLQADYDERTQHGARQGAMIIPFRGMRLAVDTTFRDTLP